jgi:hypothetical protein
MSLRSQKTVEIMVSLNFLLLDGSGSVFGSVQIITDPDPIGPKTYKAGTQLVAIGFWAVMMYLPTVANSMGTELTAIIGWLLSLLIYLQAV